MNTTKDFAKALLGFAAFLALGFVLFSLISCGTLGGAGHDLKEAAPYLPPPWGSVADIAGTALVLFAGHKTVRHVKHHRAMKKALEGK